MMTDDTDSLIRRHSRALGLIAQRRLRNPDAAADALQDTFLRYIARSREADRDPVLNGPGFLRRVLDNLVTNRQRRARPPGHDLPLDAVADTLADAAPQAEDVLLSRETRDRLKALILELPPRGRQVLHLHKFEGLSYAEIGERLGISENTVMVHMSRALARLRQRLREIEDDPR